MSAAVLRVIDAVEPQSDPVQNLLAAYHAASPDQRAAGRSWYADQREIVRVLASKHDVPVSIVAAVVSALSPQTNWAQNIAGAARLLEAYSRGDSAPPRNATLYYKNAEKAWRLVSGELSPDDAFAKAPKTRAFWRNLSGDETAATVDTWMLRAAGVREQYKNGLTPAAYRPLADAIAQAAAVVGEPVAQFQAIVWVVVRGSAD